MIMVIYRNAQYLSHRRENKNYLWGMEPEQTASLIYSPAAVLHLFNNSLNVAQSKKLIQLKGVFAPGKGGNYNGYYYDSLRDESSDAQLTICVPALIRNELQPNKTVTVNGFITRRVVNNASRIDIQLTVTDLVEQTQSKYSDEDVKRMEVLRAKAALGFRDVAGFIKERIVSEQPFRIGVIIGKTGIINQDIRHLLRESVAFYDLSFFRVSLTSESEIIAAMLRLDAEGFDIVVVSRGGGENLEIFNQTGLAEKAIGLRALFVTAIGHKEDVTLLQKVADKSFITPSEFGQFLNDTYNHTVEELQHSRAQLVESVTKQLSAGYEKEIANLRTANEGIQKVYEEKISGMTALQQERQVLFEQQLKAAEGKPSVNWLVVIAAIILGLVIGYLLKGH